jgi:hypothetical protein
MVKMFPIVYPLLVVHFCFYNTDSKTVGYNPGMGARTRFSRPVFRPMLRCCLIRYLITIRSCNQSFSLMAEQAEGIGIPKCLGVLPYNVSKENLPIVE